MGQTPSYRILPTALGCVCYFTVEEIEALIDDKCLGVHPGLGGGTEARPKLISQLPDSTATLVSDRPSCLGILRLAVPLLCPFVTAPFPDIHVAGCFCSFSPQLSDTSRHSPGHPACGGPSTPLFQSGALLGAITVLFFMG